MSSPNLYLEAAKLEVEMVLKLIFILHRNENVTLPVVRFQDLQTNIENKLPIERFKELFSPA